MVFLIKIVSMVLLFAGSIPQITTNIEEVKAIPITVQNLSKKWKLDKYKYSIFAEAPSEKEKKDYIFFKPDLTFNSVSEGLNESGNWRLDAKKRRIYLSQEGGEGELILIVDDLSSDRLVLIIDDPSDSEIKNLKIFYKN